MDEGETGAAQKVKAMIDRLQPGERLHYEIVAGDSYYARIVPMPGHQRDDLIEHLWLEPGDWDATSLMIDNMVSRGELAETDTCSQWEKPAEQAAAEE